ncbi:MAG: hypothetical protein ACRENS_00665 [Candidatus Eiseniibacteriota bacterium]
MTRHYKAVLFAVVAALFMGVLGPARAAFAQTPLDVPTVVVKRNTPHHVWLTITAGPSGAPNGVYVEWMTLADFNLYGGWATYGDPSLYYCAFNGTPSRHSNGGMSTYALTPGQSVDVVVGDLFDETGVVDNWSVELDPQESIKVRCHASGDGSGHSDSDNSGDKDDDSDSEHNNCVKSQGYWKTHPAAWPVTTLLLGTVSYTQTQLLSILNKPAGGNGLIILCHQLIATKLNIANGADPALVNSSVTSADAMIGSLVCPPVGAGFLSPSSVESVSDALDDWNETEDGPVNCGGSTPTRSTTWGHIKTLYR